MLQEKQYRREAAQKTSVAEILEGGFVETEDGAAALSVNGRQIKRVNILATIVDKADTGSTYKSMVADDGTGQIQLRLFDSESQLFERPEVGDFMMILGKPWCYGVEVAYYCPVALYVAKDFWHFKPLGCKCFLRQHFLRPFQQAFVGFCSHKLAENPVPF